MDLFEKKHIRPMLIGKDSDPFDSPDFLFELKLDGERCFAYLGSNETLLINRNGNRVLNKVPELERIHKQTKGKTIIDGELIVMKNDKPDFELIKNRILATNKYRIQSDSQKFPVTFVAFDILYLDGEDLSKRFLKERKEILQDTVSDSDRLSLSRVVMEEGIKFFDLAAQSGLEGIIAKKLDSLYYPGKRTKEWMKIKNIQDGEFYICGYILRNDKIASLILGEYTDHIENLIALRNGGIKGDEPNRHGELIFCGRVTIAKSNPDLNIIFNHSKSKKPLFNDVSLRSNEQAVWLKPNLMCTVEYLEITEKGHLRQPIYKGLRLDKS